MPPLVLSSMIEDSQTLRLREFQTRSHIKVQHRYIPFDLALSEFLNFALQSQGPDVSQIGSTWLGSLTGMAALRMFRTDEVASFGGRDAFLPASWESSQLIDVEDVYAIPWFNDVRFLAYRRDLLDQARVDETKAFINAEAFEDTLARLQSAGVENVLALSTVDNIILHVAPWIWGADGAFRTLDHRHLTLTDPKTLTGIQQFYRLNRYIAATARNLSMDDCTELFCQGGAAVVLTGYKQLVKNMQKLPPDVPLEAIAIAPVPGVPVIGGSSLVIWLHSYQEDSAVKLVQHLVSPEVQWSLFRNGGELPARVDVLAGEPFSNDRFLQVVVHSLKTGRSFQSSRKWAVIGIHLKPAMRTLFVDLYENPDLDIKIEVARRFSDLQKSIEQSLLRTHPFI
jgi:multiple sugar transport system substrate-binding protein